MDSHHKAAIYFCSGLAVGAGLLYWLDPRTGKRRRHRAIDKASRIKRQISEGAPKLIADLSHRVRGFALESRKRYLDEAVSEDVLTARIRASLGRLVSHPRAIKVDVTGTTAVLSGPVLEHEIERLLDGVRRVPGLQVVENRLDLRDNPESLPEASLRSS